MAGGKWLGGLDGYDVTVRLLPGALVVAPLVAVGVAAGVRANPVVTIVVGLVGLGGISFALRAWVRSRGKLIEEQLEDERDGLPTRHALRVGGDAWSPAQRAKWRTAVAETTNMSLEGDDEIDAAVMDLRSRTRDAERYALVDAERRSYGYERNLFGVRRAGIATSLLSVALGVMLMIVEPDVEGLSLDRLDMVLATVLSIGIGVFFVAYPRVDRVWAAGCDYAERLMEAAKPAPGEQKP